MYKKEMDRLLTQSIKTYGKYSPQTTRIKRLVFGLAPTPSNIKIVKDLLEKFEKGVDK